ncbi:AbrB/MazE/SpoVT family DNA-binding domain-containing protein [Salmonella enterica subsp. enterica serovar Vitkin]|uniref:AbrB/MazE/SpoVT family DNA-binding domain-containing protein n=3 Tax=Salmonella enterica TaxID=28901 RepID=A0A5Z6P7R8_SALET|nr:type II toxin-antitoxin system VapB family antitoxin [Salmonella enterica]EBG5369774.1 AbrB/MazE/SpoVT family DNA-binding domain-containing protein [Salmonella enterica subsp. enterica serovar Monschaui]EBH8281083.1 AbrB/MazE/SpoVT family DNA-binding domain-containing protein [Salmonella enterica subsp. enterica serovar Typhimurium str. UK-1]EBP3979405.1 AbrB/MazE/SpoVT family DNA-binding domain-containing protein [Salmonella enterica subsp. enterica]EBS2691132.1 AbrB/MazE/SpoVT family DNA-b
MRKVSIFKNGSNRAVRIPRDMDFEGINELEISREGDAIILRPLRKSWASFAEERQPEDKDFMPDRQDIIEDR